jgi:hypothetical protein
MHLLLTPLSFSLYHSSFPLHLPLSSLSSLLSLTPFITHHTLLSSLTTLLPLIPLISHPFHHLSLTPSITHHSPLSSLITHPFYHSLIFTHPSIPLITFFLLFISLHSIQNTPPHSLLSPLKSLLLITTLSTIQFLFTLNSSFKSFKSYPLNFIPLYLFLFTYPS